VVTPLSAQNSDVARFMKTAIRYGICTTTILKKRTGQINI